jgi:hypothetical protein
VTILKDLCPDCLEIECECEVEDRMLPPLDLSGHVFRTQRCTVFDETLRVFLTPGEIKSLNAGESVTVNCVLGRMYTIDRVEFYDGDTLLTYMEEDKPQTISFLELPVPPFRSDFAAWL